jgi:serine/threonine protein kinase/WD40 repeat protein
VSLTPKTNVPAAPVRACRICAAPLGPRSTSAVCPRCALRQALEGAPASGSKDGGGGGPAPQPDEAKIPAEFGHYKLLEEIGSGGFGVVYAAEQTEPIRRRVAVKVVKVGMDTRQVVARFEAERQALALMDHPNIARVFEAGATTSGRPFFVMELVRGSSITRFADEHRLGTRERIALLQKVCLAVQHAHHKGIIHRDLKPSNILVSAQDGQPEPKVIDFGIAKATQMDLTDKTVYTQAHQFIGTPAYMSPEQAGLGGLDVDARSDVYSLGALLYELLTGSAPFDAKTLSSVSPDEARRLIREENPPKPSTRVNRLSPAQRTEVAARRDVDERRLRHELRGDFDRVVMKALEKDRTRRYATAAALAEDLQRFLDGAPVNAHAPSLTYLAGKFAARHRAAVGAGVAVAASLIVGTGVSLWQAVKAGRAQQRAVASERTATNALAQIEQINTRLEHENYRAAIQLAHARIRAGEPHAALPVLWATPEKLRGWEWGYLAAQCPAEELSWDTGHGRISCLEVLADGRRVLTAGEDWRIALWDMTGARELMSAPTVGRVRDVAAAPDNRHAAVITTHGSGGRVTIHDLATGRAVFEESLPNFEMAPLWLRNGLLVVGHHGIWRLEPNPWRVSERHPGFFPATLPSAKATTALGANQLLVQSRDGVLLSLDPATLQTNATIFSAIGQGKSQDLLAWVFEPSANRFAYALDRLVWAKYGHADARPLFTNETAVRFLQSLPGADWFAVADDRVSIVRRDGVVAARWPVPFGIRQLALTPLGRVVIGDSAGFVRLYRPSELNRARHQIEVAHERECRNVSFSPGGDRLAFMDWRREASFHLSTTGLADGTPPTVPTPLDTPDATGAYHSFGEVPGFHPVTGAFVTAYTNGLHFHDVSRFPPVLTRSIPLRGRAYSVAFARSNPTFVASHGAGIDWGDAATGQTRPVNFPGNRTVPVALSADGSVAAFMARSVGEEHVVWRTADDAVLWRKPVEGTPNHLALSSGGDFLALGFYEGRTEVWDVRGQTLVQRFSSGSPVWGLRFFGREGSRLLALSEQREIHIWDWRFGNELLRLRTSYLPFAAAFSPDGLTLAVASYNPSVTIHFAMPW